MTHSTSDLNANYTQIELKSIDPDQIDARFNRFRRGKWEEIQLIERTSEE